MIYILIILRDMSESFAPKSGSYKIKNYDSYFWYQKPYQDNKYHGSYKNEWGFSFKLLIIMCIWNKL